MLNSHPSPSAEYGIPIRNLWHMLLYAWNEAPLNELRGWALKDAYVESAPTLDSLLASVLMRLMQQRLRIGLGHDYVDEARALRGIRGRIHFAETIKQHALERGQVICEYQAYGANSPKNQIIRSTLARLGKTGHFGPSPAHVEDMHRRLRRLLRDLDGIDFIELTPELIRRQLFARGGHDHDYRLMLAICDLIVQRQMPADSEGHSRALVPLIDRELLVLYNVYERFVANFYRLHLRDWEVSAQKRLEWHAAEANERLPRMVPDIVMQENLFGSRTMIVLDTKFTAHSLRENPWGKPVFDSSHLYQMYAYLKSQEHLSEAHRTAVGILLYPAVNNRFSERVKLQDQVIRLESVDLASPWQEIEKQLMELVTPSDPTRPSDSLARGASRGAAEAGA
jgi:5-methylcytosine-specific restriction enzyme subunit McrC